MEKFQATQKTFRYTQLNTANINEVFPLLCPIREKEWIDGWNCQMIHSKSGLIEKNCVFSTANENQEDSIWYVTQYSKETFTIEFLKTTPNQDIVRINICLEPRDAQNTFTHICYQYTALSEEQNKYIHKSLQKEFIMKMSNWEESINQYLTNGDCATSSSQPSKHLKSICH